MKIIRYAFLALGVLSVTASEVLAQNITNTLGASGLFKIKDGANDYFALSQTTGNSLFYRNLELGNVTNSTATVGVVTKGGDRFIHNYKSSTNAGSNTFVGINAGNFGMGGANFWEGSANTGVGWVSLASLSSGYMNSAFGSQALSNTTTGDQNSAFGNQSLTSNTEGGGNSAFGAGSLSWNSTGTSNSAVGGNALSGNIDGYNNSALGYSAGSTVTHGGNLLILGSFAQPSSPTASDEITLGNGSITTIRCNTQSISTLSDARDKKNIRDLHLGITFLMKLKPRVFNWDKREWYTNSHNDGTKMETAPTAGFIAQELDEVQTTEGAEWLKLVLHENPDRLEATAGNLFPVLVKAVQELKREKDEEITALKRANEGMERRMLAQEQTIEELKAVMSRLATVQQGLTGASLVRNAGINEQR